MSIRQRLIVIVFVVAIPLVLLSVVIVQRVTEDMRESERQNVVYSDRAIVAAVDAKLSVYIAMAKGLARGTALRRDDIGAFGETVAQVLQDVPGVWVSLTDATGRQLFNSFVRPGAALGPTSAGGLELIERASKSKQSEMSDIYVGPTTKFPVTRLVTPVFRNGEPRYFVFLVFSPDVFVDLLRQQGIREGWLAGMIDRRGNFVARSLDHDRLVGTPASEGWRSAMHEDGWFQLRSVEGDVYEVANVVSPLSGWAVGLGAKKGVVEAPIRRQMLWGGLAGGAAILLSILLAAWAARKITNPIKALAAGAEALERHQAVDFAATGVPEVDRAMLAFDGASKALIKHEDQRTRAELALRESEARFRALVMASSDVVYRMSPDWGEMRQLTGRDFILDTDAPTRNWLQEYVHPDDRAQVMAVINEAIRTESAFELEHRVLRVDGSLGWTFSRAIPMRDANGEIVEWLGNASDVTERKREAELLRQAKSEADRANLAKSKFLATASHDLRQPVQSLVLLLDVLKPQVSTPTVAKAVDTMGHALEGLNGLLTSILDVSRIDAGVVAPQIQSIDVGRMIHRLGGEYAHPCGQKALRLRCRAKPGLHARTDAVLLERILRNLIENAIRYTEHGGLLVGARRRGDQLRIDIVDSGIGIPADQLAHIFEEFYQVANPVRDHRQGLGLGLSIVSRLARLIGAEVTVQSREGRGTCFTVMVGLDDAAHEASSPSAATEVVTGRRLLVIEDNPKVRTGLQLLLESWDCEVVCAETGEEALAAGERDGWRFDAIIADHRLGAGMTGIETATEIGRRVGRPIPALIVTGDTAPERIGEVHASGFEMMHKPVTPDELARRMAHLLRGG